MKTIRVCFLIQAMSDGGAQKQCVYLLNELQNRKDVDLHLIYFFPGVHDHLLQRGNLSIHKLSVGSNYNPMNILRLRTLLRDLQADILLSWLHACDIYSFFVKLSMPELTWLMTERDSSYPPDPRYWLRRHIGIYADAIIANSEKGKAYWIAAGAMQPCIVIPNTVQPILPASGASRINTVLYAGRLTHQKNVTAVIESFCILARRRPELRFSILGDGILKGDLEDIVQSARLGDQIEFLGFRQDIADHLSKAGMVVSLSHHEGLPNVLLESVMAGSTIVASDIPEHRELLGPDYPFYVSDRNDPGACADVMEKALSTTSTDVMAFANSRISQMSPKQIAASYIDVFRRMKSMRDE